MAFDYTKLESDFDCACQDVIKSLDSQYASDYNDGAPGKLELFLELIKSAFSDAADLFIHSNDLRKDKEALQRIHGMAKKHAKDCLTFYGKVK